VVVNQDERLPQRHGDVQNRQPAMLAHGKGAAADLEPLVLFIDSLYCQIGENGYTGSSAAFALPTTERGHDRSSPLLSSDLEVLTACPVTSREPGSNPTWVPAPSAGSNENSLPRFAVE